MFQSKYFKNFMLVFFKRFEAGYFDLAYFSATMVISYDKEAVLSKLFACGNIKKCFGVVKKHNLQQT